MTRPQIIPAITIKTAAGKLTDDAFIVTSAEKAEAIALQFHCTGVCN